MQLPKPIHRWDVSVQEAKALQLRLRNKLNFKPLPSKIETVAGVDMAIAKEAGLFFAAVAVMGYPENTLIEVKSAAAPVAFPYIPGLLSFREGPAILAAFNKLIHTPDVVIFDGQGIAHPQRFGLAAHLGLWLELPSIGCAKSRLTGRYNEPGEEKGDSRYLYDKEEIIGIALRTKSRVKPLFISPGHLCDLTSAKSLILRLSMKYRLPEPVRHAHIEAGKLKKTWIENQD